MREIAAVSIGDESGGAARSGFVKSASNALQRSLGVAGALPEYNGRIGLLYGRGLSRRASNASTMYTSCTNNKKLLHRSRRSIRDDNLIRPERQRRRRRDPQRVRPAPLEEAPETFHPKRVADASQSASYLASR